MVMLFFALLFAGLTIFGACVGFGTIGRPMYGQALSINGAALAAFFVLTRARHALRVPHGASTSANHTPPRSLFD
jgi:hypothetical protein